MAQLGGTLEDTFHTPASPDEARRHFADLGAVQAAIKQGRRFERRGEHELYIELEPQSHGAYSIEGRYTVHYEIEGDDVVWRTVGEGNMVSEGRARFAPSKGGTSIDYRHTFTLELPVNRIVAKMLSPVVAQLTRSSLRRYVEHLLEDLASRTR